MNQHQEQSHECLLDAVVERQGKKKLQAIFFYLKHQSLRRGKDEHCKSFSSDHKFTQVSPQRPLRPPVVCAVAENQSNVGHER